MKENDKVVYTIQEVQDMLGLGRNTMYKLLKIKGFPSIQIGRKYIIPVKQFDEWLENNSGFTINLK